MSTILKALRRLEEQKTQGEVRPLREEVATGSSPPDAPVSRRRIQLAVVAAGVLVLAIAGGFALWQWPLATTPEETDVAAAAQPGSSPTPAPERVVTDVPEPRPTTAAQRRAERLAQRQQKLAQQKLAQQRLAAGQPSEAPAPVLPEQEALPEQAFESRVEVVPRPPVEPRLPIDIARAGEPAVPSPDAAAAADTNVSPHARVRAAAAAQTPEEPQASPPAPTRVVALEQKPTPPAAKPAPPPKPAPVAKPVATPPPKQVAAAPPEPIAEPEPPVAESKPEPVAPPTPEPRAAPAVESVAVRAEVAPAVPGPVLRVEKTEWHPVHDRRVAFVSLDGAAPRRIQEGDVIGRFVVSEIQPSGVVFLDDGQKIRRAIGEK